MHNTSTPILIRRAASCDLDVLCTIEQECFGADAFTRRQLHHLALRAQGALLVAESKGEVVGYISLLLRQNTANVRVYSVAVAPSHRGCGIARRLIDEAICFAAAHRRSVVSLEVRCDNRAAIALYESYGFHITEYLKGYYHDGSAGHRMTLRLI